MSIQIVQKNSDPATYSFNFLISSAEYLKIKTEGRVKFFNYPQILYTVIV